MRRSFQSWDKRVHEIRQNKFASDNGLTGLYWPFHFHVSCPFAALNLSLLCAHTESVKAIARCTPKPMLIYLYTYTLLGENVILDYFSTKVAVVYTKLRFHS